MTTNPEKSAVQPRVVNDLHDLTLWWLQTVPKFPKAYRFSLGERINQCVLDCMETANKAFYARDKMSCLVTLNEQIDRLRLLSRLACDLRLISLDQHEHCIRSLFNIGNQVGGWRRSLLTKKSGPPHHETTAS